MKVLSIKLYNKSFNSVVNRIISESTNEKGNRCISATSAHGIIIAQKNKEFRNVLDKFYLNLPDGMPSVWIGKLKGSTEMERCYGPDIFKSVMIQSSNHPINHYLCGGKKGVADKLSEVCKNKFGNKNIVGSYSPPFRKMNDEEIKQLTEDINNKGTNIIWIGLSTPKQEKFAYRLAQLTNVNFLITVGAAFDFHTGKLKQAPKFIQKLGLEWLFRVSAEPKRLWMRYFEVVPKFIFYNFAELFSGKFFNGK